MSLEWTKARRNSFIASVLRSGSRRWPPKYQCLADAKTEKKINPKTGRLAQHFQCASCKEEFTSTNVEVDHRLPVVQPHMGFESWDLFIERLYCGQDNLQVLCKPCHALKTKQEKVTKTK